jgi:hypothetical protein
MRCSRALFGVLTLVLMGCGSARETGKLPASREVLTAEEISRTSALTAHEAIQILRPAFLRAQGPKAVLANPRSTIYPSVYLNGVYHGELETLKTMYVSDIQDIRYIEAKQATIMFGTGHVAGIIMVTTRSK